MFGTAGADEFEFMRPSGRLGFPVARVRWLEPTGTVIGQPFFVMDFIDGGVSTEPGGPQLWRRNSPSTSSAASTSCTTSTGRACSTGRRRTRRPTSRSSGGPTSTGQYVRCLSRCSRRAPHGCTPTRPRLERVALVHGDPGPGNFVHDGHRVLALTDWEFSHLGDPTEDWSFLLSMRGARTMPMDDWLALMRREVGVEVDEEQLRYWRAFNFFKGACANRSCLKSFAGANPAPNMALIGTVLQQTFMRQLADLVAG